MAPSLDYSRLATNAARSLTDTVFEGLREAVVIVDLRPKHLPVVLANAAARSCLDGRSGAASLLDVSLLALLSPASASAVQDLCGALTHSEPVVNRDLAWRFGRCEIEAATELKLLRAPQGRPLVALTFSPFSVLAEGCVVERSGNVTPAPPPGCSPDAPEIERMIDLLAETQRVAKIGGWEYNCFTRELAWTEEMFRIFETSPQEFRLSWDAMLGRCSGDFQRSFSEARAIAESGDAPLELELQITTFKNTRIWVRVTGQIETHRGRPVRIFGSMQNVQTQKLAQLVLADSSDCLKVSMAMAHMHAWRWNKATGEFKSAMGAGQQPHILSELSNMQEFVARVHPQDRDLIARGIEQAFESRCEVRGEFRFKTDDGSYRTFATVGRPLFDEAGEPAGVVGVSQDVTTRVESEAQLRRSEQLLRTTTENTDDILILVDADLRIRFCNKPFAGKLVDELLGAEIGAVVPECARDLVFRKLRLVLSTGEPAIYEFEQRLDEDKRQNYENRAVVVRDQGGASGISISVRNITERKRLEQEILDISNRERQAIGRDLHDGLGQELTGVALMLRGLATRLGRNSRGVVETINEIVGLVNQSIESTRSLARGLLPVHTDSGGLPFALSALAARSREMYGFEVNFRAQVLPESSLDETTASHLYRIAQEAIANAARHGQASRIDIVLAVKKDSVLLEISDDGVGIGGSHEPESGMGLRIMRYRADMIGAKFEIDSNMPRGTIVRVTGEQLRG